MKQVDKKISVKEKSNNLRLDIFLSVQLKLNRSQVQKFIKNGRIKINNELPKKVGQLVKTGDNITLQPASPAGRQINTATNKQVSSNKKDKKEKIFQFKDIKIINETPDYLVINKPSGLLVHPTAKQENNTTLSDILVKQYSELNKIGDNPTNRPGIVHRLDKEASGLMVIPRTKPMFDNLKKQFKNRTIVKEYLVLVHGQVESQTGIIDFPIARSRNTERMSALPTIKLNLADYYKKIKGNHRYANSREALTEFWVEKNFINFTLLRIKIHTGRTHQIRVHMLAYNHPVVGDNIYFQKKQKRKYDEKCGRLFLHCVKLGFEDLTGNKQEFEIDLPLDLKKYLKELK